MLLLCILRQQQRKAYRAGTSPCGVSRGHTAAAAPGCLASYPIHTHTQTHTAAAAVAAAVAAVAAVVALAGVLSCC